MLPRRAGAVAQDVAWTCRAWTVHPMTRDGGVAQMLSRDRIVVGLCGGELAEIPYVWASGAC